MPTYPCPVGVKVPVSGDCDAYYECVTPYDWILYDQQCLKNEGFKAEDCQCVNGYKCDHPQDICSGAPDPPPADPGIAPGK